MLETVPQRSQLEIDAERAVRRGELKEAIALYGRLLESAPGDAAIAARISAIRSVLQPSELSAPPAAAPLPAPRLEHPPTPEQAAEQLFEAGDYAGAHAAWQRILQARPDHQLARERLDEIRPLVALAPRRHEPELPRDRAALLEALLSRISTRRR